MHILIIDDNEVEGLLLKRAANPNVVNVHPQSSYEDGALSLLKYTYDLIITDFNLEPQGTINPKTAHDVIKQARSHPKSKNTKTPIVVISACLLYDRDAKLRLDDNLEIIEKRVDYKALIVKHFKINIDRPQKSHPVMIK